MDSREIIFVEKNVAEIRKTKVIIPDSEKYVLVKTVFSTISPGTERANITGDPNVSVIDPAGRKAVFPRYGGYSSSGIVVEVGSAVTKVKPGDSVAMFKTKHAEYNVLDESSVVKISSESSNFSAAALAYIATFSLAAVRKTGIEIGESSLIMGLGPLGQLAVSFMKCAGSIPVIAVDPILEKREKALGLGADYAFNPFEDGFVEKVKEVTEGGVRAAIEVTGNGGGLNGVLDCMAKLGRVALLGCTRDPNFTVDYYRKVHGPGISLIGAHNNARPDMESYPGYFTTEDDIKAFMKLCEAGRISVADIVDEMHSPMECEKIYQRLIHHPNFPVIQFDWSLLD